MQRLAGLAHAHGLIPSGAAYLRRPCPTPTASLGSASVVLGVCERLITTSAWLSFLRLKGAGSPHGSETPKSVSGSRRVRHGAWVSLARPHTWPRQRSGAHAPARACPNPRNRRSPRPRRCATPLAWGLPGRRGAQLDLGGGILPAAAADSLAGERVKRAADCGVRGSSCHGSRLLNREAATAHERPAVVGDQLLRVTGRASFWQGSLMCMFCRYLATLLTVMRFKR